MVSTKMRFGVSLIEPAHLLAIAIRIGIPFELFVVRWLSLDHIDSRLTTSGSEQLRPLIYELELTFGGLFVLERAASPLLLRSASRRTLI